MWLTSLASFSLSYYLPKNYLGLCLKSGIKYQIRVPVNKLDEIISKIENTIGL